MSDVSGRVAFAIGTGRCGTKFLAKVVEREPAVASVHERSPLIQTFHRYCKWYGLPVDDEGFLQATESSIRYDLRNHHFSFESSAYLSLSIAELYQRFGAKFVLLVRSPERVVNSYLHKGWWDAPVVRKDADAALGYQDTEHFHHFLGRIVPNGEEFSRWQAMTRVGKLAWYWQTLNSLVLEQFRELPESHFRVIRLEDLDFHTYHNLAEFLGFKTNLAASTFTDICRSRPNAKSGKPSVDDWTDEEINDYEAQVAPLAQRFQYEFRVTELRKQIAAASHLTGLEWGGNSIKGWVHRFVQWLPKPMQINTRKVS